MLRISLKLSVFIFLPSLALLSAEVARAAKPTAAQALLLTPIQADVDYDLPTKEEQADCIIESESTRAVSGWVVRDATGRMLRRFLDSNRDNKVDLWCYYKDGVEVYRDVDADFNGKADEYRWLGTAGIRWGADPDEDGRIDSWKMISPEEVTAEVVEALRTGDAARYKRLLLTGDELAALGLGEEQRKELGDKLDKAAEGFRTLVRQQKVVDAATKWIDFGGSRPGVMPAGTEGSTKDVMVYDNVAAVIETGGKNAQVMVGTLIRVGDKWRVIDLPTNLVDPQAVATTGGFFFHAAAYRRSDVVDVATDGGLTAEFQKVIVELDVVDKEIAAAPAAKLAELHSKRADVLERLIDMAKPEERENWLHQYADTVSAATQAGAFPKGIERLNGYYAKLTKLPGRLDDAAYVKYRSMYAAYSLSLQGPAADFAKIQANWLDELQTFVKDYPKSEDAADAMLQLALAQEFAGKEDDAKTWYRRIAADFPQSTLAKKAVGAQVRLDSVGKSVQVQGRSTSGENVDLAALRSRVVLIHYWATWCEPCKQELAVLKDLQAKYGRQGFALIGVSLDADRQALSTYLSENRLTWPQLNEDGGLDSRFANELGILTLPTMILVDKQGKVISRNITAGELDRELGKLLR